MEATTDVWHIPAESASRVGHPAPFPVALPLRLIHLYTYENDLVLDPFMGSGTTAVAAVRSARKFIGYETDPSYVELSSARLAAEKSEAGGVCPASWRPGPSVKEFAQALLARTMFRAVEADSVVSGVDVSFRATDAGGRGWLFDIAGSFSASGMPGLNRADVLWKVLGKAAVLREVAPQIQFGVLATGLPPAGSAAAGALDAVCGPAKPITAVVDMSSEAASEQLRVLSGSFRG